MNAHILSDYERVRLENIKKNEDYLNQLGLNTIIKRNFEVGSSAKKQKDPTDNKRRRSNRLQKHELVDMNFVEEFNPSFIKIQGTPVIKNNLLVDDDEVENKTFLTKENLSEYILSFSLDHYEFISDKEISHCVYRINTMSYRALSNRIKTIARAGGSKSREKLLVFYYGLQLSQLTTLSHLCAEELQGLEFSIAIKP